MKFEQTIPLLREGHKVRRECWDPNYWLRITNEKYPTEVATLLIGTDGYFYHLGMSSQPHFVDLETHPTKYAGLQHDVFADDWIDGGFILPSSFKTLEHEVKETVMEHRKAQLTKWEEEVR
jgi:hypothetical protein